LICRGGKGIGGKSGTFSYICLIVTFGINLH